MAPEPRVTVLGRRLAALLQFLQIEQSAFAKRAQVDASYVSRLLSGERGASTRQVAKLIHGTSRAFQVADIYWTSDIDIDPAKAILPTQQRDGGQMGVMIGRPAFAQQSVAQAVEAAEQDAAAGIARLLKERGEPDDLVIEMLMLRPPQGARPDWWLREYFGAKERRSDKTKKV